MPLNINSVLTNKRLFVALFVILISGCKLFRPTAYFFISNVSRDKTPVDIQVRIGDKIVFDNSIKYSNIAPDLQYTPYITLAKGTYLISVTADSGRANLKEPISLDADRWIFVTFNFSRPADSIQKERLITYFKFDTAFVNKKIRGTQSKVGVYIMDKEPIHM